MQPNSETNAITFSLFFFATKHRECVLSQMKWRAATSYPSMHSDVQNYIFPLSCYPRGIRELIPISWCLLLLYLMGVWVHGTNCWRTPVGHSVDIKLKHLGMQQETYIPFRSVPSQCIHVKTRWSSCSFNPHLRMRSRSIWRQMGEWLPPFRWQMEFLLPPFSLAATSVSILLEQRGSLCKLAMASLISPPIWF